MKHIIFKVIPLLYQDGTEGELSYREYLQAGMRTPMDQKAVGVDEMRRSIRILDAIDRGNEQGADIEDADFEFLVKKVTAMKFKWTDSAFVKFVDDITTQPAEQPK